jgi:methylenetetrahydrofolate reductase (NADPH)
LRISEIFEYHNKTFSFEFFPPRNYQSILELGINVGQLLKLSPSFVSVTYGAGGTTQELSFDLVDYIQNKIGLTTMAHYTCINANKDKVWEDLQYLIARKIENLMLLRGDLPTEGSRGLDSDFLHASDLIPIASSLDAFSIGAAGYPEGHQESGNVDEDVKWMKYKIEQGADFIITQMFFDNDLYFDFVDRARKVNITKRIIPGIMPITNFKQIDKFSRMSGATIPDSVVQKFEPIQDDPKKMYRTGVEFAIKQCIDLLKRGAPGLHFYTLNKSRATVDIYSSIPHGLTT